MTKNLGNLDAKFDVDFTLIAKDRCSDELYLFHSKNMDVPAVIASEYSRIRNASHDQRGIHKLLLENGKVTSN